MCIREDVDSTGHIDTLVKVIPESPHTIILLWGTFGIPQTFYVPLKSVFN